MQEWLKVHRYREQKICARCTHCFHLWESEPDSYDEYYCTMDGVERPPSGCRGFAEERWNQHNLVEDAERWKRWAESHEVSGFGVCDNYRRQHEG